MTHLPSSPLDLTRVDTNDRVRIALRGDFDYQYAGALLDAATRVLAEVTGLRELHLDCAGLVAVDSSGLSTLLMVRRLTDGAGVRLRIDGRPAQLDRMLKVTGTLDYLTGARAGGRSGSAAAAAAGIRPSASEEPMSVRSSGPDAGVRPAPPDDSLA
ncbi:STAS domain-containing protein [Streptomyces sp. NPDC058655]|uniref:STAS domain-containing protein n=1 Tax=Streptomyces sp. NPDC058655 TaxID=3346577 RepID=UPI003647E838